MKGLEAGGGGSGAGGGGDGGAGSSSASSGGSGGGGGGGAAVAGGADGAADCVQRFLALASCALANVHERERPPIRDPCVSANFRISSRIMLITKHDVATTSVLPRARCFDDRRRAASSVISSRRECV